MFDFQQVPARRVSTQGRIAGGTQMQGVHYPSPFFDVAHTYLPSTVKQMFRWCRYYYLTNPLISATVNKMAEYPITDILIDDENTGLKKKWEEFFEDVIQLRPFLIEAGLFYMCYGNAIVSISHPFVKWLTCPFCKSKEQAHQAKFQFRETKFYLFCKKCGQSGDAMAYDQYLRSPKKLKLILWNPEDIEIGYNELTGEARYYYSVPQSLKNQITLGNREVVTTIPQVYIDSIHNDKSVVLSPDNVFHFKRPSILTGTRDRGWGVPMILSVLKDVFYLQLMKKAQEAILLERIIPLTVIFPQPGSGTSDPFTTVNLQQWKDQVSREIQRWRIDRNYIPIMPLPIGNQVIGGDGRALLMSQEVKIWSDQIVAGMGVPNEFVFGGLQWSGSNVSLRMLENQFMGYIQDLSRFVRIFLIPNVASYLGWPRVSARFKPFKMADDLQRKALYLQLNQAGKISDTTLLQDSDFNPEDEDELLNSELQRRLESMKKQQLAEGEIQGEIQLLQAKYQAKAQNVMAQEQQQAQDGMQASAPGEPGEQMGSQPVDQSQQPAAMPQGQPPGGQPPMPIVEQLVQRLVHASPENQRMMLESLSQKSPELAQAVWQALQQAQPQPQGGSAGLPLPEQRPPQRGPESALI
jgi:hypothetical protein